ncbi:MAG: hypothetical protein JWQ91_171 [Aeromicrobium sp.]|uniref:LytR C-terminal domain-containing protein n=1 Tax=Aeromicrobium sp. TaxID=1871063 RepID=UPI00262CC80E|nr:LytR C-terminal domain-containing protein [Aeromicrobium sp.]MCW2823254.1 hypothetical protein [Aeromicrobium sp.]
MNAGTRALTLALSAVVFVAGGVIGFRLLTASADTADAAPTCTPKIVPKGEQLASNLVTVNVFNASARSGLANRVLINLQANGFLQGEIGNSTSKTKPRRVAILTNDRKDARVRLVAAQFRDKVKYAEPDVTVEEGVVVVIGDDYTGLKKKPRTTARASGDISVCEPVVPLP